MYIRLYRFVLPDTFRASFEKHHRQSRHSFRLYRYTADHNRQRLLVQFQAIGNPMLKIRAAGVVEVAEVARVAEVVLVAPIGFGAICDRRYISPK